MAVYFHSWPWSKTTAVTFACMHYYSTTTVVLLLHEPHNYISLHMNNFCTLFSKAGSF